MQCYQLGRPAVVQMNGKVPFCIDYYLKILQAKRIEQTTAAEALNFITGQMEAVAGLPGVLPRYEVSQPALVTGPVTLHNIRVDRSIVGAINTGEIEKLDVVVSHARESGDAAFALTLQTLTQATIDDAELDEKQKNAALGHLSFLAGQAITPEDQRHAAVCAVSLTALEEVMNHSPALSHLFAGVKAPLVKLFGGRRFESVLRPPMKNAASSMEFFYLLAFPEGMSRQLGVCEHDDVDPRALNTGHYGSPRD